MFVGRQWGTIVCVAPLAACFLKFSICALDIIENESLPSMIFDNLNKVEWMNEWMIEWKMVRAQTKCDLGGIAWEFTKETSSS